MAATLFPNGNTNAEIVAWILSAQSVTDTITARAGGTQALATQLVSAVNRISVCATLADSVGLPLAVAGLSVVVANDGAASAQVFGAAGSTDTINSVATATGVALAAAKRGAYHCTKSAPAGNWVLILSA